MDQIAPITIVLLVVGVTVAAMSGLGVSLVIFALALANEVALWASRMSDE